MPVIYSDANIVVVDKPSGLSVHNLEDPQNLLQVLEKQLDVKKFYPVHRLDRETSGVQILALNSSHAQKLAEQFEARATKKIYHGILRGKLSLEEGVWDQPLTDKAEGRTNPQGVPKSRVACETRYKTLRANAYFTLCEFHLITGRQHQIRKHAALTKHALVGDPRYNDPKYNKKIAEIYKHSRMLLHCSSVDILQHSFKAELPKEFTDLVPIS